MIYVSSSCIRGKYIKEVVQQLVQNDIKYIELSGGTEYYPGIKNDLMHLKEKYDVRYVCHAYFPPSEEAFVINLASCNDKIYQKSIQHYRKCIQLLKDISCNVLSVHAGFYVELQPDDLGNQIEKLVIYDKDEADKRFCNAYNLIKNEAATEGITMYLENNVITPSDYECFQNQNLLMMTDVKSIYSMKEKLDFNFLLDMAHLYVSCHTLNLSYKEQIEELTSLVKWIHISDNDAIEDRHEILKNNSTIYHEFDRLVNNIENVTIESKSNIESIKEMYMNIRKMKETVK